MTNKLINMYITSILLLVVNICYTQTISPQSVNSGGTKMTQTNGSISFTVGELVVLPQTDTKGNSLGSSFTAGATITTVRIKEPNTEILSVNVFPNPTTELVNIQINHASLKQLIISITDIQGKEVYNEKYNAITNLIGVNMATFTTGTYFISLQNKNNEVLGTYQIIKD